MVYSASLVRATRAAGRTGHGHGEFIKLVVLGMEWVMLKNECSEERMSTTSGLRWLRRLAVSRRRTPTIGIRCRFLGKKIRFVEYSKMLGIAFGSAPTYAGYAGWLNNYQSINTFEINGVVRQYVSSILISACHAVSLA